MRGLRLYGVPLASALLGVVATLILWFDITEWEGRLARSEFDLLAQDRVTVIQNRLLDDIEVVRVVAGFINASNEVTRSEFDHFVSPILKLQPNIRSVEWVEIVPGTFRKRYEEQLASDGFPEGIRRPVVEGGALTAAPKSDFFYAATFVEPGDQETIPVGFDYRYDAVMRPVLEDARHTTSTHVAMVDALHRVSSGKFVVAVVAVRSPRTEVVRGFVVLTLRAEDEVTAAMAGLQPAAVSISIYDVLSDENGGALPLHHHAASVRDGDEVFFTPSPQQVQRFIAGVPDIDELYYLDKMNVAGRELAFLAMPSKAFFAAHQPWQSRGVLIAGLLLTSTVSLVFHLVGDRALKAQELSDSRASEIRAARRFMELYNSSPDVMATVVAGRITECNDTMVRVLGTSRSALVGSVVVDMHDPADQRTVQDAIAQSGYTPNSLEVRLLRQDAEPLQMLLGVRAVVSSDGALEVLCVWRDNTELKQAQEELFKSKLQLRTEERFRLTIEACPNAIIVVDDSGQVVMANQHAEALFGYSMTELIYHGIDMLMPEDIRARHPYLISTFFDEPRLRFLGTGGGRDVHVQCKDGSTVPVEIGIAPYDTQNGTHALVSITDVSRRVQAVRQLRDEKDRFHELITNTRGVLWLRDIATGVVVYISPSYEDFFGRPSDPLLTEDGREDWLHAVHPDDRTRAYAEIESTINRLDDMDVQFRTVLQDGHVRHLWVRGRPVPNEAGTPERYAGIIEDVTELMRFQHELERSNEDLERFAYVASHDLQEPLRMISSYVQLLAERYKGQLDGDADEFIGYAVDGARRMQTLVNDLLAYSRSGRSRDVGVTEIDAKLLVNEALENLRAKISDSDATVTVADDMPTIRCVQTQMIQVFQNLISNALKFRRADMPCMVVVNVTAQAKEWRFAVADNGIGIERSQRDRIFQPFTRLHAYHEYEGSGIGLAVCKRVIERLGGRIWVESELGEGSTFMFTIPRANET